MTNAINNVDIIKVYTNIKVIKITKTILLLCSQLIITNKVTIK